MTGPLLVLVSGPPAAGKTTVGRTLASALGLPLIAKDDIKESLADSLGSYDEESSKRLGAATWEVLFVLMERFVSSGASSIFESNFYPDEQRERLMRLRTTYPYVPFEVHCSADPAVLAGRQNTRPRHPVHRFTTDVTEEMTASWSRSNRALELTPDVVRVDTSRSEPLDLDPIVAKITEVSHGL